MRASSGLTQEQGTLFRRLTDVSSDTLLTFECKIRVLASCPEAGLSLHTTWESSESTDIHRDGLCGTLTVCICASCSASSPRSRYPHPGEAYLPTEIHSHLRIRVKG